MERKIGEIFEFGGDWYQCVNELPTGGCVGCAFFTNAPCAYASEGNGRNIFDHTGLIFKKLEKYGGFIKDNIRGEICQPYTIFDIDRANSRDDRVQFSDSKNDFVFVVTKQNQEDMEEKKIQHYDCFFDKEQSKSKLKPFDLKAAKAGKPVCTRDGRKARIICCDAKRKDGRNIIALVPSKDFPGFEDLIFYPNNGNYCGGHENDGDLMMLPERKEGWAVIFKDDLLRTEKEAQELARNSISEVIRIEKIEWEE